MKKFKIKAAVATAIIIVTLFLLSIISTAYQAGEPNTFGKILTVLISAAFIYAAYSSIKLIFKSKHQYYATKQFTGEVKNNKLPEGKTYSPT